jgi:hypothetical protein
LDPEILSPRGTFSIMPRWAAQLEDFMDDPDRFRTHAERCRKIANTCANSFDKEAWLKLGADWLLLAELREGWPKRQGDKAEGLDEHGKARAELLEGSHHSAAVAASLPSAK